MAPNPVALALSKETGRGYHEVRVGINRLVNAGWTPFDAIAFVDKAARTKGDIEATVLRKLARTPGAVTSEAAQTTERADRSNA